MPISTSRPALGIALDAGTPIDRQALATEALQCIIAGRPLPERVRPAELPLAAAPMSVEAGIARILGGPRPA